MRKPLSLWGGGLSHMTEVPLASSLLIVIPDRACVSGTHTHRTFRQVSGGYGWPGPAGPAMTT